jgi:hypothetical protein
MAKYVKYQTDEGGTVLIEVAEEEPKVESGVTRAGRPGERVRDTVVDAQAKLGEAMETVRLNAQTMIDKVKQLSDRPDEVEVTFGLKVMGELGNLAVAKAGAEANYTVTLTWK